tara:strand:+ start:10106 stop:10714 length:609 start_codon:yes stop_codon:yes gene_type:complete
MKNAREFEGRTIRDYPSWTLQDYRDFMFCVEKGYLVQNLSRGTLFMINEEWEGDDIYAEEFLEEEEAYCECDFPKFIINDGIQSCSRCGKDDHYKCGVVADHSEDEEEGHYIVYGEFLEYDDDGVCSGSYNDEFTEFKSKEEALLEYNRLIKNNGDKDYDLIYLDYIDEDEDQDNVECWEKGEPKEVEKPKKKIKFRVNPKE